MSFLEKKGRSKSGIIRINEVSEIKFDENDTIYGRDNFIEFRSFC